MLIKTSSKNKRKQQQWPRVLMKDFYFCIREPQTIPFLFPSYTQLDPEEPDTDTINSDIYALTF